MSDIDLVIEHFDEIVRPDGGSVRLLAREGATLRVAYRPGSNDECATCVIPGADLAELMKPLVREHDDSITDVVVVEES